MSNIQRFSGFNEGDALPAGTYICIIDSDRLSADKRNVKGKRGVAYRVKDDPNSIYVIGDGFYWRGPLAETHKFEVAPVKYPEVKLGDSIIGETLQDILIQSIQASSAYSQYIVNPPSKYSYPSYTYKFDPAFTIENGQSVKFEMHVDYLPDDKTMKKTVPIRQPAVPKGPPPRMLKPEGRRMPRG
jgi:hypothetical protein